jgi:ribokinase
LILVFGSLNIDMVMRVEEMPRPGNTLLCPGYDLFPGGKGANQAAAAALSGHPTSFFGSLGKDIFAEKIKASLTRCGVTINHIQDSPLPTGCATICVDREGENMIVVASGANTETRSQDVGEDFLTPHTTLLTQCEVPCEETWHLIKRAKEKGGRTLLNLAPARKVPVETLAHLDYLIMNEMEVTILALHLGFREISPTLAAREIAKTHSITCIVTLGKRGAFAASPQEEWKVPALSIDVVDTTAAGDVFSGTFAARLDAGDSLKEALQYAAVASGLSCTKLGAQTSLPTQGEISEALPRLKPLQRVR